jgi:hypothetical protein
MAMSPNPVVLLGAGASYEAGIPLSVGMTEALAERLREYRPFEGALEAFNFVRAQLSAHDASRGRDPSSSLDVESVFDAVSLLSRRDDVELAAFVSAWHPSVKEFDTVRMDSGVFDNNFREALELAADTRSNSELRDLVLGVVRANIVGAGGVYRRLTGELIKQVYQLLNDKQGDVSYLNPLVHAGRLDGGIAIATLNYDLTIETACEEAGVPYDTGIERWSKTGVWKWPPGGVRLMKLHGSVNWIEAEERGIAPGQLPSMTVREPRLNDRENACGARALIFGHGSKLRAEGPSLSLRGAFEEALSGTDRLITVGYSFRDPHVDDVIRRWFNERPSSRIVVVDPKFPEHAEDSEYAPFRDQLIRAFDADWWHSSEQAIPDPGRLEVHRECTSKALLHLFPGSS